MESTWNCSVPYQPVCDVLVRVIFSDAHAGNYIRVSMCDDRLEILGMGRLPNTIALDNMRLPERPRKIRTATIQVAHVRNRVTSEGLASPIDRSQHSVTRVFKEYSKQGVLKLHGTSTNESSGTTQSRRLPPSLPNLVVPKPASFGVAPPSRLPGRRPPRLQRRFTLTLNPQLQRASASFLLRASSPRYTRGAMHHGSR